MAQNSDDSNSVYAGSQSVSWSLASSRRNACRSRQLPLHDSKEVPLVVPASFYSVLIDGSDSEDDEEEHAEQEEKKEHEADGKAEAEESEKDNEKENASHVQERNVNDVQPQIAKVTSNNACSTFEPRDAPISDRPVRKRNCRGPRRSRHSANVSASVLVEPTEGDEAASTNATCVSRSAARYLEGDAPQAPFALMALAASVLATALRTEDRSDAPISNVRDSKVAGHIAAKKALGSQHLQSGRDRGCREQQQMRKARVCARGQNGRK